MRGRIFYVTEYGASGDGCTVDTAAIQQAIDVCSHAGGGTVLLENGVFVCGTIVLKSNVMLEVAASAVLLASPAISDYRTDTHHNRYRNEPDMDRCFIYAKEQENIGLCGMGKIMGNAECFPNKDSIYRPMMMRFLRCKGIRVMDLCLYDAAAWTTTFLDSSYIWVERVTIRNEKRYNGDGLDFDGCSHVFVNGCSITGTDDNLCLQASSRDYPVEDIHISNCEFTSICAAIRVGLKSIGDIRNVVVSNCTMKNVWREGIKIECTEGGSITDITVTNITMHNVSRPIFVILNNRFLPEGLGSSMELKKMPEIGTMENLLFSNIIARDDEEMAHPHYRFSKDIMGEPRFNGIRFDAEENHPIKNVTMSHLFYESIGGVKKADIPKRYPKVLDLLQHTGEETSENYYPDWSRTAFMDIRNIQGLYLSDVRFSSIHEDEREPYIIENSKILKEEIWCEEE